MPNRPTLALCSTEPDRPGSPESILRACRLPEGWAFGEPDRADLIIFAESHRDDATCGHFLANVRAHPVFRRNRSRCVVHCGSDRPVPLIPGFYPSIPKRWHNPRWSRSSCYLIEDNPCMPEGERTAPETVPTTLASFVGACRGKDVRQSLLEHRSEALDIRDTGDDFIAALRASDAQRIHELKRLYIDSIVESSFTLCPRGAGTSSIRLFEAMRLGRAPVIIADDWVEPEGPDWSEFAVRIPEGELASLEPRLRALEHRAPAMGRAARRAWLDHFSPDALLTRMIEQGTELVQQNTIRRLSGRVRAAASSARPEVVTRESRRLKRAIFAGRN